MSLQNFFNFSFYILSLEPFKIVFYTKKNMASVQIFFFLNYTVYLVVIKQRQGLITSKPSTDRRVCQSPVKHTRKPPSRPPERYWQPHPLAYAGMTSICVGRLSDTGSLIHWPTLV